MAGSVSTAVPRTAKTSITASLSTLQSLNGLFAIYKKQGPTSAEVLNTLKETLLKVGIKDPPLQKRKRRKQMLKMGHGGTLDSNASGILVVGIGNGTKMLSSMLSGSKKYVAVAELGKATDTLDATGTVVLEKDFEHISRLDVEKKLQSFTGDIMQVPPLYSALKKDGQRLSVLLKSGQKVEAKPARAVKVYSLTLQDFKPPLFTLDIECGGGFYVRSLVDDLGKALSSCAHVKELTRTKQGQFTLQDHVLHQHQWTLDNVLRSLRPGAEDGGQNQQRPAEPGQHQNQQRPAEPGQHQNQQRPAESEQHQNQQRPAEPGQHQNQQRPAEPGQHQNQQRPAEPEQHQNQQRPAEPEQHQNQQRPAESEQHQNQQEELNGDQCDDSELVK